MEKQNDVSSSQSKKVKLNCGKSKVVNTKQRQVAKENRARKRPNEVTMEDLIARVPTGKVPPFRTCQTTDGQQCKMPGCTIFMEENIALNERFRNATDIQDKDWLIASCLESLKDSSRLKYTVKNYGYRLEICRETLMGIFEMETPEKIDTLMSQMLAGKIF